ncbi:MAG: hypothetical protein ABFE01_04055 [Phycisphaerales bacterium]|jgi:hypothetical protein
MAKLSKGKLVLVVLVAGGVLIASAIAWWSRRAIPPLPEPSADEQRETPPGFPTDANGPSAGDPIPLGSRFGCNSPAAAPVLFLGPPPRDGNDPDLITPASAIQTILSLIDRGAADKLASCVLEEIDYGKDSLYPRYLGQPVGLVEVIEDGDSARVVWEAAVHAGFTLHDKRWSVGETMIVTSRMVRVGELWKLLQWHEGDEDGEEWDRSANRSESDPRGSHGPCRGPAGG